MDIPVVTNSYWRPQIFLDLSKYTGVWAKFGVPLVLKRVVHMVTAVFKEVNVGWC
jgi:hypothetical protein